ncbi:MAG: hypothetical protein KC431_19475, partial [Myxococcales bacterium]|nr:hypothetical protein [Myxococcales bacterium]
MSNIDLEELRAHPSPLVVYVGPELSRAAGLPTRRQLAQHLLTTLPAQLTLERRRELTNLAQGGELADAFSELERELT